MSQGNRQRATPDDVQREASRYIFYELGDRLWAGEPAYDERHEQWTVPIHSRSLSADVALGQITLDTHGVIVRAPSRRAITRAVQRHLPAGTVRASRKGKVA